MRLTDMRLTVSVVIILEWFGFTGTDGCGLQGESIPATEFLPDRSKQGLKSERFPPRRSGCAVSLGKVEAFRRSTNRPGGKASCTQVDFPVERGPNKKNDLSFG